MLIRLTLSIFAFGLCCFAGEIDLSLYEKSLYSQNGEDGLLVKVFHEIDPSVKFCVECGAGNGKLNNHTYLLRKQGWKCILLDRKNEIIDDDLYKEFISADNINELFEKYNVPSKFGFLSIDVEYNTFYFWKALDEKFAPSVVVVKYNPIHLPSEDKVVKYRPYFCGDGSTYFGAGILSFYQLGKSKGYSLVCAEKSGTHLFFVRDEVLSEMGLSFKHANDVEKIYQNVDKTLFSKRSNHIQDVKNRAYVAAADLLK